MTSDSTKPQSHSAYTPTPRSSAFCLTPPLDRPPTASGSSFLLHNAWGAAKENHGTGRSEVLGIQDRWPSLGLLFHPRVGPAPGLTVQNDSGRLCPSTESSPSLTRLHVQLQSPSCWYLSMRKHTPSENFLPSFSRHPWLASYWQSSPSHHSYTPKGCLHHWCPPICVASTLHHVPSDV